MAYLKMMFLFPRWDMLISWRENKLPRRSTKLWYLTLAGWIFQTSQLPGEDAAEVIYQLGTFGWHFLMEGPWCGLGDQNVDNPNTPRKSMGISLLQELVKQIWSVTNSSLDDGIPACLMCCSYFLWGWLSERRVCQWLQKPTAAEE